MFAALLVGIAALWSAVVVDVVAESASSGGRTISLLGHTLSRATPHTGVIYLAALAASAAIGLAAAISFVSGRRMERRMAGDLDDRWDALSRKEQSETRLELFEWQVGELDTTVNQLVRQRDNLLEEMGRIRERTAALREAAIEQLASLERFSTEAGSSAQRGEPIPELVVIPDPDLGDDASTRDAVAKTR
jgi:hypothetical protein